MKRVVFLFCLYLSITGFVSGQKVIDTTYLECRYKFYNINISKEIMDEDLMVLQIGKKCSKFYSQYTHESDSLNSTPEGRKIRKQLFMTGWKTDNFPYARTKTYVHKNYPPQKITVTDGINIDAYKYVEDLEKPEWQISGDFKELLGYSCQKAVGKFRGRTYEAWFTPQIPVDNGPWKFSGLPGLIMEIEDTDHLYRFEIVGIQRVHRPVYLGKYSNPRYIQIDRKAFLQAQRKFLSDMFGQINATSGITLVQPDGSTSSPKELKYDFMETDYR